MYNQEALLSALFLFCCGGYSLFVSFVCLFVCLSVLPIRVDILKTVLDRHTVTIFFSTQKLCILVAYKFLTKNLTKSNKITLCLVCIQYQIMRVGMSVPRGGWVFQGDGSSRGDGCSMGMGVPGGWVFQGDECSGGWASRAIGVPDTAWKIATRACELSSFRVLSYHRVSQFISSLNWASRLIPLGRL